MGLSLDPVISVPPGLSTRIVSCTPFSTSPPFVSTPVPTRYYYLLLVYYYYYYYWFTILLPCRRERERVEEVGALAARRHDVHGYDAAKAAALEGLGEAKDAAACAAACHAACTKLQ